MGTGKQFSLHETDDTRAATAAKKFDEIVERVEQAGGEIIKDEIHPLYVEIGMQEGEIGEERIIEFNLNKTDFKLIRRTENCSITGKGQHKSLEELEHPRVKLSLKRKPQFDDDWLSVDLDEMF